MRVTTLIIDGTNDRVLVVDNRVVGKLVLIAHSCNRYMLTECNINPILTNYYYGASFGLWCTVLTNYYNHPQKQRIDNMGK